VTDTENRFLPSGKNRLAGGGLKNIRAMLLAMKNEEAPI
jgi:hypothetical protein